MSFRRRVLVTLAAGAATVALVASVPSPAAADTTPEPTATAYAAAANVNVGGIKPQFFVGGLLGGLFGGLLNTVLDTVVNPIVSALANLPQEAISSIVTAINGTGLTANDPALVDQPESDTISCSGLPADSCYSLTDFAIPPNGFIDYQMNSTAGWTVTGQQDAGQPVVAQAHTSAMSFSMFNWPLLATTESKAVAECPTVRGQNATAQSTQSGISFFNLVKVDHYDTATGTWALSVNQGGTNPPTWQDAGSLDGTKLFNFQGSPFSLTTSGHGIMVTFGMAPYDLLGNILPASVLDPFKAVLPQAGLKLSMWYGPGATTTSNSSSGTSATAWGDGFGVDFSGAFEFGINGLATVGITIPTGLSQTADGTPTSGNLMSLQISYAKCSTQNPAPSAAIPPGVN